MNGRSWEVGQSRRAHNADKPVQLGQLQPTLAQLQRRRLEQEIEDHDRRADAAKGLLGFPMNLPNGGK